MKKILNIYAVIILSILLASCETEIPEVTVPDYGDNGLLSETYPLSDFAKAETEGVYYVEAGRKEFGGNVVLKWSGNYLSVFTGKNTAYMILQSGHLDSVLIFEGYWRFASGSQTGVVTLHIKRDEGGRDLMRRKNPETLIIRGLYGIESTKPENPLTLIFERPLTKKERDFWIIGHRGGGRNSDRLPASENSVEIILFAERLGANSIEIDVKLTLDGIPILYHDANFSQRLINEDYFIGEVSQYTFKQIRAFTTLINGEKIPTLEEALDVVINNTKLKLVWLDIKSPGLIEVIAPLQKKYLQIAEQKGRQLEILFGMPSEDVYDEFINFEGHSDIPSLCELDVDKVLESNAMVWAPRWSLGTQNDKVEEIHKSKKRAFVWTLDDEQFIETFFNEGSFDGFLSNYPSVIAYEYYIRN